ncbi:hypothetical protein IGB42_00221 [Andreprevotia sp. IGB-42]|nr:hypothetical protein IGB42_00221 [Andreprevotia sp. IGB-42]
MAVTQLLARVDPDTAAAAASSEQALAALLSFELLEHDAFIDFDWSPKLLKLAAQCSEHTALVTVLSRAFGGEALLNAAFADGPSSDQVYSEVRFNCRETVRILALELEALSITALSLAKPGVQALMPDEELPERYEAYVTNHALALKAFYADAAAHEQVVVSWWD